MEKIALIFSLVATLSAQSPLLWLDIDGTEKAGNAMVLKKSTFLDGAFRSKKGNDCTIKSSAQLDAITTQLTIAAWVALKTIDENHQTVLFKGDRGKNPEAVHFALSINYGYPELKWKDEKGDWQGYMKSSVDTKAKALTNATRIAAGKWQHLAVTLVSGVITVFINGEVTERATLPKKTLFASQTDITPGAMFWATTGRQYYLDGLVADVRIYATALDHAAIKTIVAEGKRLVNADASID